MKYRTHLFFLLLFISCTQLPQADFYESEGIISIEARNMTSEAGWDAVPYHTSVVMKSRDGTGENQSPLSAKIYVQNPGVYSFWVLSSRFSDDYDENKLPIRVTNAENVLIRESQLQLTETDFLKWVHQEHQSEQELLVEFAEPGHYHIHILSGGNGGLIIDKLHLSLQAERIPAGRAYPETSVPGVDPVLAKRDQPIVIPPAWAFGTLIGSEIRSENDLHALKQLLDAGVGVDSYWIDESLKSIDQEAFWNRKIPHLKKGLYLSEISGIDAFEANSDTNKDSYFNFLLTDNESKIEDIRTAFQFTQEKSDVTNSRGFLLSPYNVLYEPDFKLYPAIRSAVLQKSGNEMQMNTAEEFGMRALRKNIKMVAGARYSLYEAPFMAPEITWPQDVTDSTFSEELFIRWLQFSAFNSIFNITGFRNHGFKELVENLTDRAEHQLVELTRLRNRLFPYIYSKAHLIRAGGVKPVRAIGERTTQFKFGDAFLVAPIYTPGADQRTVYLPEGRWYDYWSGTLYQGGQSWIIEAPLEKIPVFVRAGSIIPYREFSGTVMEGSNKNLKIEVYGGGASSFRLYETDGITTHYQGGDFATTAFRYFEHNDYATFTIGRMVRSYEGQAESKDMQIVFKYVDEPTSVIANDEYLTRGESVKGWHYENDSKTLYLNWQQPNYVKTDFRINF